MLSKVLVASPLVMIVQTALAAETTCPEFTALQRWAGYLSWMGFFKTLAVVAIAAGIIFFFSGFLKLAWESIWLIVRNVADVLAYATSFGLIALGNWMPEEYRLWPVMIGSILFAGSMKLTIWLRKIKTEKPTGFFAILTVVWGTIAIYYNMSEIGFLAVGAFMGILGFSVAVSPLCYAFGFENEKDIDAGTAAALMILLLYVLGHIFYPAMPNAVKVFMTGAFWLGSLVGYIGLLILSSKWVVESKRGNYAWMQIITIAACIVGVAGGSTFGINALAGIAGTLFVFYLAGKLVEIPTNGMMGFGLKLMLIGAVFSGAWMYAKDHEALIKTYLTTTLPI